MATTASINIPLFGLSTGSKLDVPYPLFALVGQGAVGVGATASITFPLFSLNTVSKNYTASLEFPLFSLTAKGSTGGGAVLSRPFPLFSLKASGGKASHATIPFPLFSLEARSGRPTEATASIAFPLFFIESASALVSSVPGDYEVWVLNVESGHHSTYSNWEMNSLGRFNGQDIAAMSDGIYLLEGENDAGSPIESSVYWPPSDLAETNQKAIEAIFVRLRGGNGAIRAIAVVDETEKRLFPADMAQTSDGNYVKRIPFPRGLRGNLWQFGLENVGDGKLDLFEIEVVSVPLKRKIK